MKRKNIIAGICLAAAIFCQITFGIQTAVFFGRWFEWINFCTTGTLIIVLLEHKNGRLGWIFALVNGFFLDLYSQRFFGFWIIVLTVAAALIKFALKKYVRIRSFW